RRRHARQRGRLGAERRPRAAPRDPRPHRLERRARAAARAAHRPPLRPGSRLMSPHRHDARRRRQAGFSVPELAVALAMVSVLLGAGITASHNAITTTNSIVSRDSVDSGIGRAMHRVEEFLVSASGDSLEGVPADPKYDVYGVPEPMQEGVAYSQLRFRSVVGFAAGAGGPHPPAAAAPRPAWPARTRPAARTRRVAHAP